jgi:hypothetical protein
MRISKPLRGRKPTKRLDLTDLREAVKDQRVWCALGVVIQPDGEPFHFELVTDGDQVTDVLVDVETQPDGLDVTCRLAAAGASQGAGLWRVPAVGDEVAVLLPDGDVSFMPTIVAVLSSGEVPRRAAIGRTVLVAPDSVEVIAPKVYLGPSPDTINEVGPNADGLVHGIGIDPFTGKTYAALGNTTVRVFAKKT